MLISQIKLYTRGGRYQCRIDHDGKTVKSGWHRKAPAAYAEAEARLVYKPGYVNSVPRADYE